MIDPEGNADRVREFARLDSALDRALVPWRRGEHERALLFSGGVDSSLLAWELRTDPGLRLVTVGTRGSPDLASAESAAGVLGLAWRGARVSGEEGRAMGRRISPEIEGVGRVSQSVLISLALALARTGPREVLCGQGADELFLGYAHYRGLAPPEAEDRAERDRRRLEEEDWPRSQRIAARFGKCLVAPYLHPEFVAAARCIPIDQRLPQPQAKSYFRAWARHRGLPEELAVRPKRAMQYGSGIDRALRTRA